MLGKSILKILTGNIFAQVVILLSALVLVRIYPPEAFGVMSFVNSLTNIFAPFSLLKLNLALPRAKNEDEVDGLFVLCLRIAFYSSLITFLILMISPLALYLIDQIAPDLISSQKHEQFLKIFHPLFLLAIAVLMFLRALNRIIQDYAAWHQEFGVIAKSTFYSTVVAKVQSIGAGLYAQSGYVLFSSQLFQSLFAACYFKRVLINFHPNQIFKKYHLFKEDHRLRRLWQQNIDIPKYQLPSVFFVIFMQSLPGLLFAMFYPLKLVGCYAQCQALLSMPLNLINDAISRTFYPALSKQVEDTEGFSKMVLKALEFSALICSFPMILLWFLGVDFFVLLLGETYIDVGKMAVILVPAFLMQQLFAPLNIVYNVLKQEKQLLKHTSANTSIRAISMGVGIFYLDIYQCLRFDAILQVILYGLQLAYILRQAQVKVLDQIKGACLMPCVAIVCLLPLTQFEIEQIHFYDFRIIFIIFGGLTAYLGICFWIYPELWAQTKKILRR
jgi:lipopolysaccharide exporter